MIAYRVTVCGTVRLSMFRFMAVPVGPGTVEAMRTPFRPVGLLAVTRGLHIAAALALTFVALRSALAVWPNVPLVSQDQDGILDVVEAHNFIFGSPSLGGIWSWGLENRYLGPGYLALAAVGGAVFSVFGGLPWIHFGVWAGPVIFSQLLLAYAAYRLARGFNPLVGWGFYAVIVFLMQRDHPPLLFFQTLSYTVIAPGVLALGAFMALYSARRTDAVATVLTAGLLFQTHPAGAIIGAAVASLIGLDQLRALLAARRSVAAPSDPPSSAPTAPWWRRSTSRLFVAYLVGFGPVLMRFLLEGPSMLHFRDAPVALSDRIDGGFRYLNDALFPHDAMSRPLALGTVIVAILLAVGCSLLLSTTTWRFGAFFATLHLGLLVQAFVLSWPYPASEHSFRNWYPAVFTAISVSAVLFVVLYTAVALLRWFRARRGKNADTVLRLAAVPAGFAVVAYAATSAFSLLPLAPNRNASLMTERSVTAAYHELAEKLPDAPMVLLTGPRAVLPSAIPVYAAALTAGKPVCAHISAVPNEARVETALDYLICTQDELFAAERYILVPPADVTVDAKKWRLLYDKYAGRPNPIRVYEDIGEHSLPELLAWPEEAAPADPARKGTAPTDRTARTPGR